MEFGLVAVWLLLYAGLGLLALPAASLVFAHLSDRGAGLAIPLSFGVIAFGAYWIGQVRFGYLAAFGSVAVLAFLSAWGMSRSVPIDLGRYRDAVVVFTIAYLFLLLIRVLKPGVWPGGGEKFLDFGLLASLVRSPVLPPEDVWFANEPVRYYYGGHMLAAVFSLLTDTAPRYAYNTALAGYYAAYVTAAWGLAGTIASGLGRSYKVAGGLAAFFVGIASNLSPPVRLLIWALPDPAGVWLADLASLEIRGLATGPDNFNYWFASRVIDWRVIDGDQWHLINEFPFFGFLNGDLHGHMMSPVFLLLGVAIAYSYWRTPPEALSRRRLLLLAGIPPIGALLLIVNTWSFPAIVGIAWLTLLFAPAPPWEVLPAAVSDRIGPKADRTWWVQEGGRIGVATMLAVVIAGLGALAALPFILGPASGRGLGFLPEPRSGIQGLLLVHGTFLSISAAYLASRAERARWGIIVLLFLGLLALTWALQATAVALFVPLLLGAWYLLRTRTDVDFETMLLVGVLGLLLLVEFVYVVEEAGPGRSNTVFKIYAQVWALWAVGAGAMGTWFFEPTRTAATIRSRVSQGWRRVRGRGGSESATPDHRPNPDGGAPGTRFDRAQVGTILLSLAIVSLSIYGVFSLNWVVQTGTDDPTLDSHAYIEERHPEEAAAIEWLGRLEGQPTMVSAPGTKIYRWVNGPSSMTGIPTVAGWAHEIGYRGREAYFHRVHDVDILFETGEPESRAVLLRKYDVEYIYVGPIERSRYETVDYAEEQGISVAYADDSVTIYRVDQSALVEMESG